MIEAVENHMPQVIVIDEIGTELEAQAARTIAERGVQLIGTAHGNNLDNLMLNPTLSDLIGGIQSVTLGDEEARRRRTQKSVLERKAPPTFDVIIEIQDRERVMVHTDVADTVDAMLRGDPVAPELRWRDEEGVHRSQARPRPSPREQLGAERFAGLVGTGSPWRMEPGWRGDGSYRAAAIATRGPVAPARDRARLSARLPAGCERRLAPDPRRVRAGDRPARPDTPEPGAPEGAPGTLPGERFAVPPVGTGTPQVAAAPPVADAAVRGRGDRRSRSARAGRRADAGAARPRRPRVGAPAGVARAGRPGDRPAEGRRGDRAGQRRRPGRRTTRRWRIVARERAVEERRGHGPPDRGRRARCRPSGSCPHGVSRKRLEQAIRELQLPVVIARDVDEADVVMTLRSEYRQKTPVLREAEERAMPIYVLKSNTILQMQASLTSIFALEVDPREAALRETEEAIGLVQRQSEAVELSPQNAYIRRLQHQMAERANLVSRSRGREPYRRVRLYPDAARSSWR